ncbi:unnamed protein product [Protopolystoma xenopodis]|uniref:Uncharacterized protein n=1 Tax=Protopolystoma xenopodis TaxID=117903 RepID=A0A448WEE2_9PLAT|nr:unnamed protein product [Protopolystoma xenopodis]
MPTTIPAKPIFTSSSEAVHTDLVPLHIPSSPGSSHIPPVISSKILRTTNKTSPFTTTSENVFQSGSSLGQPVSSAFKPLPSSLGLPGISDSGHGFSLGPLVLPPPPSPVIPQTSVSVDIYVDRPLPPPMVYNSSCNQLSSSSPPPSLPAPPTTARLKHLPNASPGETMGRFLISLTCVGSAGLHSASGHESVSSDELVTCEESSNSLLGRNSTQDLAMAPPSSLNEKHLSTTLTGKQAPLALVDFRDELRSRLQQQQQLKNTGQQAGRASIMSLARSEPTNEKIAHGSAGFSLPRLKPTISINVKSTPSIVTNACTIVPASLTSSDKTTSNSVSPINNTCSSNNFVPSRAAFISYSSLIPTSKSSAAASLSKSLAINTSILMQPDQLDAECDNAPPVIGSSSIPIIIGSVSNTISTTTLPIDASSTTANNIAAPFASPVGGELSEVGPKEDLPLQQRSLLLSPLTTASAGSLLDSRLLRPSALRKNPTILPISINTGLKLTDSGFCRGTGDGSYNKSSSDHGPESRLCFRPEKTAVLEKRMSWTGPPPHNSGRQPPENALRTHLPPILSTSISELASTNFPISTPNTVSITAGDIPTHHHLVCKLTCLLTNLTELTRSTTPAPNSDLVNIADLIEASRLAVLSYLNDLALETTEAASKPIMNDGRSGEDSLDLTSSNVVCSAHAKFQLRDRASRLLVVGTELKRISRAGQTPGADLALTAAKRAIEELIAAVHRFSPVPTTLAAISPSAAVLSLASAVTVSDKRS